MKRFIMLIMALVLTVSLIGCGTDDLNTYMEATRKTNEIQRGKMSFDITMEGEHNIEGLSQDEIKQLNYFKKIEAKADITFDDHENKVISRTYFNFGGMGFDMAYYINGDKTFIKMPIVGKYLEVSKIHDNSTFEESPIKEETLKQINEEWLQVLNTKDVVSGEKTLLNTEDGEVKVTRFIINPSGEQIKAFLSKVINIAKEDEKLRMLIEENMVSYNNETEKSYNKMFDDIRVSINNIVIKDIKYEVFIDMDGYIIENDIEVSIEIDNTKPGEIKSQRLIIEGIRWGIEKDQKFDFPVLNKENTLNLENVDQGIPFMFEDIFKPIDTEGGN